MPLGFLSPSFYRVAVERLPQILHVDAVDDFKDPLVPLLPPQAPRRPSVAKGRPVMVPPSPPVVEGDGKTTGGFPALEDLGARELGPTAGKGSPFDNKMTGLPNVLAMASGDFITAEEARELQDLLDSMKKALDADRADQGSGVSDKERGVFGPNAENSDSLSTEGAKFGAIDLCLGAAVLTRGCTPQRYTQRVYTFSTDVKEIQRQQLMIGACLVVPAVAMYAVSGGIAAGIREGFATLIQWARPIAPAF